MRKISFLLIGLMFGLMSFAQEHVNYVPLISQDGVKWVYYMVTQDHDTIPYTIEFKGDTLVNNHNIPQMVKHDLHVHKCYMTFSKPLVNPNTNEIIFNTDPMLVGWGTDHFINHHTYMHYTKEYRSKVRRYCLPLDIVDDEFDEDCFHDMGWIGQNLESTNQYWGMMPYLYNNGYYQFDNTDEVEVDGQTRTLFSSTEIPSPYSQYINNLKPLQAFMMTGIGWFGNYYGGPNSDQQRCNFSNFLSPFGQLRGNYSSRFGSHVDDLYNFFESFFSHQEKDGRIIFKSIWYMGDNSTYVAVDKVNVDKAFGAGDNRWYNLMGQPFENEPTQPGIYIHQGKKVVVK